MKRAILDLVDNTVDAAVRTAQKNGLEHYSSFWVKVEAYAERFAIRDFCGGMSVVVAKNVAFRFDRPQEVLAEPAR